MAKKSLVLLSSIALLGGISLSGCASTAKETASPSPTASVQAQTKQESCDILAGKIKELSALQDELSANIQSNPAKALETLQQGITQIEDIRKEITNFEIRAKVDEVLALSKDLLGEVQKLVENPGVGQVASLVLNTADYISKVQAIIKVCS